MFKNQPKGLIPAALANMGERFGFYTMMAILTLFLMSKFGLDGTEAGGLYSFFYGAIYILALVGGIIADRLKNYKGTIIAGLIVMSLGYLLLAMPSLITTKYIALGILRCSFVFLPQKGKSNEKSKKRIPFLRNTNESVDTTRYSVSI